MRLSLGPSTGTPRDQETGLAQAPWAKDPVNPRILCVWPWSLCEYK